MNGTQNKAKFMSKNRAVITPVFDILYSEDNDTAKPARTADTFLLRCTYSAITLEDLFGDEENSKTHCDVECVRSHKCNNQKIKREGKS